MCFGDSCGVLLRLMGYVMDTQGLLKTVQAICIAACLPQDWLLMIICPKSMQHPHPETDHVVPKPTC